MLDMSKWRSLSKGDDWEKSLKSPEDEITMHMLRRNTRTGRPLGSDSFMSKIEIFLGRRVRALPVGWKPGRARAPKRPRKGKKNPDKRRPI